MQTNHQKLSFKKVERLKSKKQITKIFEKGKKIKQYPFVLNYLFVGESDSPIKIVVSVPKRLVKFANKRNRLKRQIKEAYRLNKADIYQRLEQNDKNLALFLIYTGKEKEDYHFIEKKLILLLNQLKEKI